MVGGEAWILGRKPGCGTINPYSIFIAFNIQPCILSNNTLRTRYDEKTPYFTAESAMVPKWTLEAFF
jgi:hypothetical protein